VTKLEVVPAATGCRPPGHPAGEHDLDYTSSYPDLQKIGCHTGPSGEQVHHAVTVAMYRCRRCDTALLAVSPSDSDRPEALFEVFGGAGPGQ
jgi:hypothetical protein